MKPFTLHLGDCIEVMRGMAENSVDAIVCDPPYGLEFMGNEWDGADGFRRSLNKADAGRDNAYGRTSRTSPEYRAGHLFQDWCLAWATEALRVLKPGGHLLAFSGTRTSHRMVCAIEDSGFEIRDSIPWIYGSGMVKSRNMAKYDMTGEDAIKWDGWGTACKPAHEPCCMARKPLAKGLTVAANVLAHGTGAINIDACRVEVTDATYVRNCSGDRGHAGTRGAEAEGATNLHTGGGNAGAGRWPANIIHDGSAEVVALFPAQAGASAPVRGTEASAASVGRVTGERDRVAGVFHGDTGSAARFFYCAKASRKDRNEGCEAMAKKPLLWSSGTQNPGSFQAEGTDRSSQNHHPTVKPTDLMAYLVRLVTPPGGLVLDPFMGSGSTGKACMREGFRFIGIDLGADYIEIARARIEHELARVIAANAPPPPPPAPPQLDMFAVGGSEIEARRLP